MFVKFLIASHESHLPPAEESSRVHRHQNLQRSRSPHVAPWVWSSFDISSCQSNWVKRTCNYLGHPSLTSSKKSNSSQCSHIIQGPFKAPINGPNWLNKIQGEGQIFKNFNFGYGLSIGCSEQVAETNVDQVEGNNAILRDWALFTSHYSHWCKLWKISNFPIIIVEHKLHKGFS